jgi:hypothetical protein
MSATGAWQAVGMAEAYFQRIGPARVQPTAHVRGAWSDDVQHIAPAMGVLVHTVEQDRDARRDDGLVIGRLGFDILGTVPVEPVDVAVRVLRLGRTIELVEASLAHEGRTALLLRAWLLERRDTAHLAGTALPRLPPPEAMPAWRPTSIWPGGYIASADVRRIEAEPGRAASWVRTAVQLIEGEAVSPLARAAALFDIANGLSVRVAPDAVAFPNVDLTAHLSAEPSGEWLGFDTTVTFGADGRGITHSTIHDHRGPLGTVSQLLTVRPG